MFVTLSEALNFTYAAKQLHLSQSALSRHILELEEELGHKLFVRTTRKVELTEFGRNFLAETHRVLNAYNRLLQQALMPGEHAFGSITIGTPDYMTRPFLPLAIRRFLEKYPCVDVNVQLIEPGNCVSLIQNGVIDLGFFAAPDASVSIQNVEVEIVSSGKFVLAVPEQHPLARRKSVSARDLKSEHIYINHRRNVPLLWNVVTQFLIQNNISLDVLEEVKSPSVLMMFLEAGLGCSILSENFFPELEGNVKIHTVNLEGLDAESYCFVAYPAKTDNSCVKNFITELSGQCGVVKRGGKERNLE